MKSKLLLAMVTTALLGSAASALAASDSQQYSFMCSGGNNNSIGDKIVCNLIATPKTWHWSTLQVMDLNKGNYQCGSGSDDSEVNGRWVIESSSKQSVTFGCVAI